MRSKILNQFGFEYFAEKRYKTDCDNSVLEGSHEFLTTGTTHKDIQHAGKKDAVRQLL